MSTLQRYDSAESCAIAPYSLVTAINGDLFVESTNLADGLGIRHKNLLETIAKYLEQIQLFGRVAFETRPFETEGGAQEMRVAMLNENQALFVGSLSRNTEKVVAFKVRLIEEFDKARKALMHVPQAGLVKLVNDLLAEVSELKRGVNQTRKEYGRVYEAKVMADVQSTLDVKIKREQIMMYVSTVIRRSIGGTWKEFWDQYEKCYNVDIRGLDRKEGEHTLDVAIRNGHLSDLMEYITRH